MPIHGNSSTAPHMTMTPMHVFPITPMGPPVVTEEAPASTPENTFSAGDSIAHNHIPGARGLGEPVAMTGTSSLARLMMGASEEPSIDTTKIRAAIDACVAGDTLMGRPGMSLIRSLEGLTEPQLLFLMEDLKLTSGIEVGADVSEQAYAAVCTLDRRSGDASSAAKMLDGALQKLEANPGLQPFQSQPNLEEVHQVIDAAVAQGKLNFSRDVHNTIESLSPDQVLRLCQQLGIEDRVPMKASMTSFGMAILDHVQLFGEEAGGEKLKGAFGPVLSQPTKAYEPSAGEYKALTATLADMRDKGEINSRDVAKLAGQIATLPKHEYLMCMDLLIRDFGGMLFMPNKTKADMASEGLFDLTRIQYDKSDVEGFTTDVAKALVKAMNTPVDQKFKFF